jgi:hypothetical protein
MQSPQPLLHVNAKPRAETALGELPGQLTGFGIDRFDVRGRIPVQGHIASTVKPKVMTTKMPATGAWLVYGSCWR